MAPRASWTGYLRISLVTIPVRLYAAISSTNKVTLHLLHKGCDLRLHQQLVCPEHGKVERSDVVKGYEFEKDHYVVVSDADLAKVRLETTKTIEVIQFIDADDLDPIYLDTPFYVAPDGAVAEESFRIVRDAMQNRNKIAIGQVVIGKKEHVVALDVQQKGLILNTLFYSEEIRPPETYFEDIKDSNVDKSHLSLAEKLIDSLAKPFNPEEFHDRYQASLSEVVKRKIEGSEPVFAPRPGQGKVVNLMDALKQSLATQTPKKAPAASVKAGVRRERQKTRRRA
jgi:DNA end-binding protein Ku